ncbi:MAG: sigma-70 family RNA polymerase sigma factor [Myxococcota bacterium]|nr:sigma-70 family RNA polymerase sigma factor [Myxococcota bacterium]
MAQTNSIIDLDERRRERNPGSQNGTQAPSPAPLPIRSGIEDASVLQEEQRWFESLMKSHGGKVVGYYRYKLRDEDLAHELMLEAFTRVWSSRKTFRGDAKASTWLWTIARRVLAAHFDTKRRHAAEVLVEELPDVAAEAEDEWAQSKRKALSECLKTMNDKIQQTSELVWLLGYSYVEAAAIMDESADTVRMRLKRARAPLQQCLESKGVIGDE